MSEIIVEGVAAEYNGKYWGIQYQDGHSTSSDFGELDKATISDPRYCKKPTDMTYDPKNNGGRNPDYDKLGKARLVPIRKTIKVELL
jgi:hypothetical protein